MEILTREAPAELLDGLESTLLRRIYVGRGVKDEAELDRSLGALLAPTDLPDADKAAQRLADAIQAQQKILIVGDFDADGATAVALCMCILRDLGSAPVEFLVPNRFEFGYGLSPEIVELANQQAPDLIVTVDNGVSSVSGVRRANELGIDVIVTDHHLAGPELPAAYAIVNPNLPNSKFVSKTMAGVGVAYYVLGCTRRVLRDRGWFEGDRQVPNLAQYLDLVALGTVADVVPLDANNRIMVHQGVQRMRAGKCLPGIKAIAEIAKRSLANLSAQDLGFALGPRLNAAGRLEDMSLGIKCLLAPDLPTARKMATALDQLNKTRRELELDMVTDAELMLAENSVDAARTGLTVYHASFHQGVVGIVAGRLREKFNKPVIAFADAGDASPDELKGSARSIVDLHIRDVLDWIAASHPGLLIKFGGHAMAAGLSIKRAHLQRFGVIFDKAVQQFSNPDMLQARLITDGSLEAAELSIEMAQTLAAGGPWGSGFPEPSFCGEFEVISQRVVGELHLKLVLKTAGRVIDAIAFRQPPLADGVAKIKAVYRLSVNDYGEWPTVQLVVEFLTADA
jgi:single-stranded-DNA-specific exonuclease